MARKRRNDRNHVIYEITNVVTGDSYVGLTVCTHGTSRKGLYRAIERRFQKHVCRALRTDSQLPVSIQIRDFGPESFEIHPVWIVRGKDAAHEVEREVVADLEPSLNVCLV